MRNKTYWIKKDNIIDALDDIDRFIQGVDKINNDNKARSYRYIMGIDPTTDEPSKYEINLTLIRDGGDD